MTLKGIAGCGREVSLLPLLQDLPAELLQELPGFAGGELAQLPSLRQAERVFGLIQDKSLTTEGTEEKPRRDTEEKPRQNRRKAKVKHAGKPRQNLKKAQAE
jgi:hypothetical protein